MSRGFGAHYRQRASGIDRLRLDHRTVYAGLMLGVSLGLTVRAWAAPPYTLQPIIKAGDTVEDVQLRSNTTFHGLTMNDRGDVAFVAENKAGVASILLYTTSNVVVLTAGGREAAGGGTFDTGPGIWDAHLISINQQGNIVFPALVREGSRQTWRTFLWESQTQKAMPILAAGVPASPDVTIEQGLAAAINNRNEVVAFGSARDGANKETQGVFLRSPDGQLTGIALTGQELPGGRKLARALWPSLNDAGMVAFIAQRQGEPRVGQTDPPETAYLWDKGTFVAPLDIGSEVSGKKVAHIWNVHLNNKNRNVLVQALIDKPWTGPHGLILAGGSEPIAVALPGQPMPGGGQLRGVRPDGVSAANDLGQHAFVAQITEDGSTRTAIYLMDADGSLSLVLKSGTETPLGVLTRVGASTSPSRSIALNSKGQIAVPVKAAGVPETLVLLSPSAQ